MKRNRKKSIISYVVLAGAILGAGLHLLGNGFLFSGSSVVFAAPYQSSLNNVNPVTAPASYVVNIPDANLRTALNQAIAAATSTTRANDAVITAGDMRTLTGTMPAIWDGVGTPINLSTNRLITNPEGLQFLINAKNLDISKNRFTNLEPLRELPNLERLDTRDSRNLSDISAIPTIPKLKWLYIGVSGITNLAPLASAPKIEDLHIMDMKIEPGKLDLSQLSGLTTLKRLQANTNRLSAEDFNHLKNLPNLEVLMAAGNNVTNLQTMLSGGFTKLAHQSAFVNQLHTVNNVRSRVISNPIRGLSGEAIPITETADVKNANADGTENPNGEYIKIVKAGNTGTVVVDWFKSFTLPTFAGNYRDFTGKLTLNYDLDLVAPTFTPSVPAKIISRKGVAINITDVTAQDEVGGSGLTAAGITNNASAISLNPASPAAGNYTLTYLASDNAGNTATVGRQIDITDADALQSRVDTVTAAMLDGMTSVTVAAVNSLKAAAETIITNNTSTQAQINQALTNLNDAISALRADKTALQAAIDNYNVQPDFIKSDSAVATAFANANATNNAANPSVSDVANHASALNTAITNALNAEATKQNDAENALNTATTDKTPASFAAAQAKIDLVQNPAKKNRLSNKFECFKKCLSSSSRRSRHAFDSSF